MFKKNMVSKLKEITFQLSTEAKQVNLVGDFNEWSADSMPLRKQRSGVWLKQLSLSPGRYEYRYIVDGAWWNDPDNNERLPNPFGSENNVLKVS